MTKEFFNLADHQLNGESDYSTHWGNFGYWQSASTYPKACEALAILLGDASGLDHQSQLLDCGFGCGDQLLTWANHYKVSSITGVNLSESQTQFAKIKISQQKKILSDITLHHGNAVEYLDTISLVEPPSHIIALDCTYHFKRRTLFFKNSYNKLSKGGTIALTDLTFRAPTTFREKLRFQFISILLKHSQIPKENLITKAQYQQDLKKVGFNNIEVEDITTTVLKGFCDWLDDYKHNYPVKNKTCWMKYDITSLFLKWAIKRDIIHYNLITARK